MFLLAFVFAFVGYVKEFAARLHYICECLVWGVYAVGRLNVAFAFDGGVNTE